MSFISRTTNADANSTPALKSYEENTDLPLMVLAVAVIPLVAVEIAGLKRKAEQGVDVIYELIWVVFLADYVIRMVLSRDKRLYVRQEWLALALVVLTVPFTSIPYLHFLRGIRTLRLLRVFRFGAALGRSAHRVIRFPKSENSQLAVAVASFIFVTLVSAVLVLAVEEGQVHGRHGINSMENAIWWAVSTVSTVGYGDVTPVTTAGRLLALIPMLAGVLLIAVVVSNLAARLYKSIQSHLIVGVDREVDSMQGLNQRLTEISDRLARLEQRGDGLADVVPPELGAEPS